MTLKEQKKYILKEWKTSSGKKITEMTSRYYKNVLCGEDTDLISTAKEIFDIE